MNSTRYQYVNNTLGVALTTANFPYTNDGDDKKVVTIKRKLAAADIGTAAGQTRHALGAIVGIIPATSNVLLIEYTVQRPLTPVSGITPYTDIGGVVYPLPTPTNQENTQIALGLDNTIRVIDAGGIAQVQLAAGDLVIVKVHIGTQTDSTDVMNP